MNDKKRNSEITRRVMADAQRYPCTLQIADAWRLHMALNLARKHPALHRPMKQELRQIMLLFRAAVVERYPATIAGFDRAEGMAEAEFIALTADSFADKTPIIVELSIRQTWLLVSAVQVMVRHPKAPDRETHILLARQFQQQIGAVHPEAWAVLEMGWHSQYDAR